MNRFLAFTLTTGIFAVFYVGLHAISVATTGRGFRLLFLLGL